MDTEQAGSPCLNVARWVERSEANGPGTRFVLWLQGCPLRCVGCWNPDTWDSSRGMQWTVDNLIDIIRNTTGIEGVTITGGEPFDQAEALEKLTCQLHEIGLTLMIFTGYELDELKSSAARNILSVTDIAVTGRFVLAERVLTQLWRGSRNQRVHFLSNRYRNDILSESPITEIIISENGQVAITGFPDNELIQP